MTELSVPKKRNREESIQRLLDAGVKVFSTYGYDASTTRLIAQESGINESLISRYFDGKAGLLVEIIRGYMEKEAAHGSCVGHAPGETLQDEIQNFFQYKFEHYLKTKAFLKVMLSRAIIDPQVAMEMQRRFNKGGAPQLLERLRFFQLGGVIRSDVDIERTCFTITHTCFSMGFLGHTVMGLEKDFITGALADFARDFSAGIKGPGPF